MNAGTDGGGGEMRMTRVARVAAESAWRAAAF